MTITNIGSQKHFSMTGTTVDGSGNKWEVTFALLQHKTRDSPRVFAKCDKLKRSLRAPENTQEILDLWPQELWPEFAQSLAIVSDTQQKRLF